jgi:DNA-directed RNA polymerase specialized sigma24 family protein
VLELSHEERFLSLLPHIDRVVARLVRQNRLTRETGEDFAQCVKMKFIADDYAVLEQWRGDSSLEGYATIVIGHAFQDFRNSIWGKYRPSAFARRLGPIAVLLEQYLVRDQLSFDAACEELWRRHAVAETRAELEALLAQLPLRTRRTFQDDRSLDRIPAPSRADELLIRTEREAALRRAWAAIDATIAQFAAEDAVIMAYRFKDGKTVKQIALILGIEEKPLFPRIQSLIGRLRRALEREGIDKAVLRDVLSANE